MNNLLMSMENNSMSKDVILLLNNTTENNSIEISLLDPEKNQNNLKDLVYILQKQYHQFKKTF
jgi:hypothetical protein